MCLEAGIAPPKFEEITVAAVVTFKVNVRGPQQVADQVVGRLGTDAVPSPSQVTMAAKLLNLAKVAADIQTLMEQAGRKNRTRFRNVVCWRPPFPTRPRAASRSIG